MAEGKTKRVPSAESGPARGTPHSEKISKSQLQSPEFTHKMQIGLKQMNRGEQQGCRLPDPLRSTRNELLNLQWDGEAGEKVRRNRGWGRHAQSYESPFKSNENVFFMSL